PPGPEFAKQQFLHAKPEICYPPISLQCRRRRLSRLRRPLCMLEDRFQQFERLPTELSQEIAVFTPELRVQLAEFAVEAADRGKTEQYTQRLASLERKRGATLWSDYLAAHLAQEANQVEAWERSLLKVADRLAQSARGRDRRDGPAAAHRRRPPRRREHRARLAALAPAGIRGAPDPRAPWCGGTRRGNRFGAGSAGGRAAGPVRQPPAFRAVV